ncbi:MAG: hypothetical protein ACSLEX_02165 [Minisyncoccota bacterium]
MEFISQTSLFFLALGGLLMAPGWVILHIFFPRRTTLSIFETFLFSFALSIGLLDFLMIFLGTVGFILNRTNILLGTISVLVSLGLIKLLYRYCRPIDVNRPQLPLTTVNIPFNARQQTLFILLIGLTILIKTFFLAHAVLPTATDLGHHMYWAKYITITGTLPTYEKQEIITDANEHYQLTAPQPIDDFIIGEHLPFAGIQIFTHLDFFSAFPVIFLLFVNIFSTLALFVLAFRLAESLIIPSSLLKSIFTPSNVALVTLFFFGPLYTLASPQAKFVSGGVVGNIFGNFFIPLIILTYLRAFQEKRSDFLALGMFFTFALAYTHHLSMLILIFILLASVFIFLVIRLPIITDILLSWWKLFISPAPLSMFVFACLFFLFIAMPTYISIDSFGTALGTPTKTTRTGLSFLQISESIGQARVALGVIGMIILLFIMPKMNYAGAFLAGWSGILIVMTFFPHWLFIDIPSNRIGSYLSFPLGILASFATLTFLALSQSKKHLLRSPSYLFVLTSGILFLFVMSNGSFDNSVSLLPASKAPATVQTFSASHYLAQTVPSDAIILKDHNYIVADSWIKLFFMQDYAYPLSRGFFKRYQDNPSREQCTFLMISVPNTPKGEKCYNELGVNFVIINPKFDSKQFEKSSKFSRVYVSDDIHIYKRLTEF